MLAVYGELKMIARTLDLEVYPIEGALISWDTVDNETMVGGNVARAVHDGGICLSEEELCFVGPPVTGKGNSRR
jgi:hypothetical protein